MINRILITACIVLFCNQVEFLRAGDELSVTNLSPAASINNADHRAAIAVTFDQAVNPTTITTRSFWAFGRWSGAADGKFSFSNNAQTVTLTPERPFSAGEQVMVILSNEIEGDDGSSFRSTGLSYQFFVRAETASMNLTEIAEMTTRDNPNLTTRSYGGFATDLNEDGWMDLTIVNEDSADLRTFLNQADHNGVFHDFLTPPAPVNDRASPSEPSDFNRDGHADTCVVNIDTNSVSVLLGNGDGTFAPQQEISVGIAPRGIAVLDVDGDGDIDIVNTNSGNGNLSLMLNDGKGVFGAPTFFQGGGSGEWALAAADMDNDNVLDLVVGARSGETMIVNKNNGDGTFSIGTPQAAGGSTWMIACGDLNGDGNQDVTTANSTDNDGAVLFGDGNGGLSAPVIYDTDLFPLATDVADLDGDGDLDWVTSSFIGDWIVFKNNGAGVFTMDQEIDAPVAASCSLGVDIDNDRDLDLVLIDELEDVVIVMRNGGHAATPDQLTPIQGLIIEGSLVDLETSNNQRLSYFAEPDLKTLPDMLVEIETESKLASDSPASLVFELECLTNTPGISQAIEIFNFNSGQFELVATANSSFNEDAIQSVDLTADSDNYVEAGTRLVRARIGFQQIAPVLAFPWSVSIDKVAWINN